jgi:predicted DCC family thiol-disulfide oxidoreductase YuxK
MKPNRTEALKRAGLVGLVEAADALPGVGPLLAGAGAFYRELTQVPRDLPEDVREVVKAMAADFRAFLQREGPDHADQTVAIALAEALAILDEHGLAAAELVETAGVDATQAARRTLDAAADRLRLLDAGSEALTRRLVDAYYCVLLDHRDALAHVGVPALRELLQ